MTLVDTKDHIGALRNLSAIFDLSGNIPEIVKPVLDDQRFAVWTGSGRAVSHHYGKGGLARHTFEVASSSDLMARQYGLTMAQRMVLFVAAVWHDYGKIWDHKPSDAVKHLGWDEWANTDHKRNVHHLSRSAIEFNIHARKMGLNETFVEKVTHCILSHHGQLEWRSPVQPNSPEAWILHLCDNLSARMDDGHKLDIEKRYK